MNEISWHWKVYLKFIILIIPVFLEYLAMEHLCVVQIGRRTYPTRDISLFSIISCEIPTTGNFTDYGISLLRRGDGVKFLVYQKSQVKSPGAPSRVCTTPNLNHTLYTHFKKICLVKIFWKSLKSLNYWKKGVLKNWIFGAVFEKVFAKSWRIMRF